MKYSLAIETNCENPSYFVINTYANKRFSRSSNIANALQMVLPDRTPHLPVDIDNFTVLVSFDSPLSVINTHPELFI